MIDNGGKIKHHIENKAAINLTKKGLFLIAMVMVTREGAEIVIFSFAGKYPLFPMALGITLSLIFAMLIHKSLIKINLNTLFSILLVYLILQAGFLLGYSIHEGLSAMKSLEMLSPNNPLFNKAFDLSKTIFYHEGGIVGVPLYITLGWYSKPEWIQFLVQYGYTGVILFYWKKVSDRITQEKLVKTKN